MTLHRLAAALAVVACLVAVTACGSDKKSSSKPKAVAMEISGAKGNFSAKVPAKVDAGLVKITFKNSSKAPQDGQLVRVDGDRTEKDVITKVIGAGNGAPTPSWAHGGGGVGTTAPGQSGSATQVLTPGNYYLASSQSEGDNGPSSAKQGAIAKFEVTGDGGGTLPTASSKIVAREYSFTATNLKSGHNQVEFDNAGKELHHVVAFPYVGNATEADVLKAFQSNGPPKGKPPVDFEAGSSSTVLDGGEKQVTDLNFKKKGRYELVCFLSDRKGGPPHFMKGMRREVTVK